MIMESIPTCWYILWVQYQYFLFEILSLMGARFYEETSHWPHKRPFLWKRLQFFDNNRVPMAIWFPFFPEEWLLVPVPGDLTLMMNCQVQSELGQINWLIVFKPNEKRKSVFSSITCQGPPHLPVSWDQQCSFPNRQYGFPCHLVHKQKVKENDKWQMD